MPAADAKPDAPRDRRPGRRQGPQPGASVGVPPSPAPGVTKPSDGIARRPRRLWLEPLLLDLLDQRRAVQAEELRRPVLVPVRLLEGLQDQVRLEVLDDVAEGEAARRNVRGGEGRG